MWKGWGEVNTTDKIEADNGFWKWNGKRDMVMLASPVYIFLIRNKSSIKF